MYFQLKLDWVLTDYWRGKGSDYGWEYPKAGEDMEMVTGGSRNPNLERLPCHLTLDPSVSALQTEKLEGGLPLLVIPGFSGRLLVSL